MSKAAFMFDTFWKISENDGYEDHELPHCWHAILFID